MMGDAE